MDKLPRHTCIFSDNIDSETVQSLIDTLSVHDKIDLFFTTSGGETFAMEALIHYLNARKKDIEVYLTDVVASCGAFILVDFQGKIHLSESLECVLFHVADRMLYTQRKNDLEIKALKEQVKEYNTLYAEKFKSLGFTAKEIIQYKQGKDVILYRKDFHRLILPQAK
jgi:ATP-dependent protease ClpP protease subunit